MRQGKSTSLKNNLDLGQKEVTLLDVLMHQEEFTDLTKEFGGKIIKDNEIINPLEILKAGEDDRMSYSRHISKLSTFLSALHHPQVLIYLRIFKMQFKNFMKKLILLLEIIKDYRIKQYGLSYTF